MNKTELINAIAEKSGLSKVDSKKALEAFRRLRLIKKENLPFFFDTFSLSNCFFDVIF